LLVFAVESLTGTKSGWNWDKTKLDNWDGTPLT